MRKRKTFSRLSAEQHSRIKSFQREIPGYWTTQELAELQNVGTTAVVMQVQRGKLNPVKRKSGQQYLFSDAEVMRYLSEPSARGRPRKWVAA